MTITLPVSYTQFRPQCVHEPPKELVTVQGDPGTDYAPEVQNQSKTTILVHASQKRAMTVHIIEESSLPFFNL